MMEKYEIEKLRQIPIEEVAGRLGLRVTRHKCLCPFHDDHHASLSFSQRRNSCRCFVCMQQGMGNIDLVMRLLNLDFPKACRWLADAGNVYLSETPPTQNSPLPARHPAFPSARYLRFFEHPWLSGEAQRFLFEERRIDPRVARWCRLTSWQDHGGTHWLQIPYFSTEGELIGVQNRNLDYRAKDTSRGGVFYGSSVKCVDGYNSSLYELEYVAGCTTLSPMLRIKWLHIPSIDR